MMRRVERLDLDILIDCDPSVVEFALIVPMWQVRVGHCYREEGFVVEARNESPINLSMLEIGMLATRLPAGLACAHVII